MTLSRKTPKIEINNSPKFNDSRDGLFPDIFEDKQISKIWADELNDERVQLWCPICNELTARKMNRNECLPCHQRYKKNNPGLIGKHRSNRRAKKMNSLHPDRSDKEIERLHSEAKELTEQTGKPHHVDHIYPLSKGGYEHQDNMRVIPAIDNLKKNASVTAEAKEIHERLVKLHRKHLYDNSYNSNA